MKLLCGADIRANNDQEGTHFLCVCERAFRTTGTREPMIKVLLRIYI
jgi:hypothetical protein